jgi:hypothetical protein
VVPAASAEELADGLYGVAAAAGPTVGQLSDVRRVGRAEQRKRLWELQARRAEIYQSWLARESMASLIGAILVLVIGRH